MAGYNYKVAYGAWINDMRSQPMLNEGWPSITLDEQAEEDIINCLELQSKSGFNVFEVWGLLVTFSWPLDIKSAVDEERKKRINRIIKEAHNKGMKIVIGLGVYSWGFDEIIKNCAGVSGPNPHAMCGSKEESWEWMKKILDFLLTDFNDLDGIHIESADLGRCNCESCSKVNDIEYHSKINIKVADYVKENYTDKIVMVTSCGFKTLETQAEINYLIELSKHIDYLISPNWWHDGQYFNEEKRLKFIKDLKCDFGSSGGFWVYPPQRWERLKWFLPYARKTGENIKQLYKEGGRALEYYMGPSINPSTEVNIAFGGRILSEPTRNIEDVLFDTLKVLYNPQNEKTCQKLVEIFLQAEDAYFNNCKTSNGELRLTHLWGTEPGPECYLSTYDEGCNWILMDYKGRTAYKKELTSILEKITTIEEKVMEQEKLERVKACINNVIVDLDALGYVENI